MIPLGADNLQQQEKCSIEFGNAKRDNTMVMLGVFKAMPRRKLLIACLLILGGLGFVPLPLQIGSSDKVRAVVHALRALQGKTRVITDKGYDYLIDNDFVKDFGRTYYTNDLGIPDTVFQSFNLKPIPRDRKLNVDAGDIIVAFSSRDMMTGKQRDNVQFAYVFGSLGAEYYEIRIYRSLLLRYFVFKHTGES
jgi:hypothetical protein